MIHKIMMFFLTHPLFMLWAFLFIFGLGWTIGESDENTNQQTTQEETVRNLPPLDWFNISSGMTVDDVANTLRGKADRVSFVSPIRYRKINNGKLDGTYNLVKTHSIHYEIPYADEDLRVYFHNDRVYSIRWTSPMTTSYVQ